MNKTTEYIDALLLSEREKAALPKTDIRAVHQALDAEHRTYSREDDSPQGSVKARLEHAWPDSLAKGQLIKDDEGRDQLQAMPKSDALFDVSRSLANQPGWPFLGSSAWAGCNAALCFSSDKRRAGERAKNGVPSALYAAIFC